MVRREYLSLADLVDAVVELAFHKIVVFNVGRRFQRDKRFYYSFRWGRVGIYNIKIVFFTGGIWSLKDEIRQVLVEDRKSGLSVLIEIQHVRCIRYFNYLFNLKSLEQLLKGALGHYELIWGLFFF